MFKHAYVRGIQTALINSGYAVFPDADTATKVADYLADRVDLDPLRGVPREVTHKIATAIVEASDYCKQQPNFKAASFDKVATWDDVEKLASMHAEHLMMKAAEGSTLEGGDKGNKEPTTGEGKMDREARPEGYATDSLGKTDVDTKPGMVGKEIPQPTAPHVSPSGSNSVTEHSRTASVHDLFRKAAEGSTLLGGDKGNMEPTTGEGKMDMQQRPEGYARLPSQGAPGWLPGMIDNAAVVGKEVANPAAPSNSPSGTNSVTEHSAKAAEDEAYLLLFKKTAAQIVQYIPSGISDDAKIAHVRVCMGLETDERARYLGQLQYDHKVASERAAVATATTGKRRYDGRNANQVQKNADDGALPPFMKKDDDKKDDDKKDDGKKDDGDKGKGGLPDFIQAKIDARKDGDDDKKDDDKKDDDKKEAAMRDTVARIAASLRA